MKILAAVWVVFAFLAVSAHLPVGNLDNDGPTEQRDSTASIHSDLSSVEAEVALSSLVSICSVVIGIDYELELISCVLVT